jgi:hypothetical protein
MAEKVEAFFVSYGSQERANSAPEFRTGALGGLSQRPRGTLFDLTQRYPSGEDRGVTGRGWSGCSCQAASLAAAVFQFQGSSASSFWML